MKFNLFGYTFEFYRPVVHREGLYGLDFHGIGGRDFLPFADGEVKSVLMMVTNRMANAEWHAAEGDPTEGRGGLLAVSDLFAMVERFALLIVWRMFKDGFCDFDAYTLLPCGVEDRRSEVLPEEWRGVKDRVVRVYDDVYINTGKTRAQLLAPALAMLDTVNNSDLNLIDNYGAMGVLSPENSTVSTAMAGQHLLWNSTQYTPPPWPAGRISSHAKSRAPSNSLMIATRSSSAFCSFSSSSAPNLSTESMKLLPSVI